jgi:hypothetical protein
MKHLSQTQLDSKISSFLNKKLAKYPDLNRADGVQGRNILQLDKMVRSTLKLFEGKRFNQSKL